MHVIVTGGLKDKVLLSTDKATGIVISDDQGNPNCILKMLPTGNGWLRFTRGEDSNFNQVLKDLGIN